MQEEEDRKSPQVGAAILRCVIWNSFIKTETQEVDKFVGILRIHPPPLATEHDFNGHGNKEPEYLSYDFI